MVAWAPILSGHSDSRLQPKEKRGMAMSTQAVGRREETGRRINIPKDNWLGFIGDVTNFTGEVQFKSMLRIDGHFSGRVTFLEGTLLGSDGAELIGAAIEVAVAQI